MHYKQKHIYIGVDLHKNHHTAVIIDCWHEKLGEIKFENKPSAFPALLKEVKKHTKKGITPIYGLEDVGGYGRSLAVFLIENNQIVKEVNSALSFAERKSYPTIKKSDSWDAYTVAYVLLNKLDILPDANPHDLYWAIGQLVTRRNGLVKALTALKNQLHIQLSYHYPSYKKFFSEIDGKTALAFFQKYPAPHTLKGISINKLTAFLLEASNNSVSKRKAKEILSLITADGDTKREYQEHRDFLVKSLVRDIEFKKQEIEHVEEELILLMDKLDYKLDTMPGIDLVTASALVAEIGDIRRFPNPDKLARFAGIAPVNFSSGGKGKDKKSKQGNRTLHGLFYFLAVQQVQISKGSKNLETLYFYEYYQRKLKEGDSDSSYIPYVFLCILTIR
ncbi:IS110 family transposase [Vulcanibacillus modesticaldus]|uniref:IS110 family transposase n=1 Tax=Vulcanibacillus modesticaldus TaxID=337097 RepID=A0A1D2YTW0_9BACI|nr:IS110 family transposase [Vulcanibacillus modesticaldus]OEF99134.1 IS110 family transposase [Vulcanibacillus modesticaldus]